jgi:hypothetical protein
MVLSILDEYPLALVHVITRLFHGVRNRAHSERQGATRPFLQSRFAVADLHEKRPLAAAPKTTTHGNITRRIFISTT